MPSLFSFRMLIRGVYVLALAPRTLAQTTAAPTTTAAGSISGTVGASSSTAPPSSANSAPLSATTMTSSAPDVYLNVPTLSVGKIELDVENLQADLNLAAKVASLVTINAGVQVSITKVNITIADVDAELELTVRLGHLVDIVNRVFQSLDLNPLLINTLNNVTSLATEVVGAVDGLLGSITRGGTTLNFLVDNLGNIVQEVAGGTGSAASTIVGNYAQNMTLTGAVQQLGNGLVQKTYQYSPLNALVNIVFNAAGQVVQATVQKAQATTSAAASATAASTAASTASS